MLVDVETRTVTAWTSRTSQPKSAGPCTKLCPPLGIPLERGDQVQDQQFWTNDAGGGDSTMPSTPSSVADAFRTTLDLFETGLDLMRQNLRRSHPDAHDEEIERLLHAWLLDRPGAESGDCPGRLVDVNTRLA